MPPSLCYYSWIRCS